MRLRGQQAVTVFCMAMDIPHIFNAIDPRFKSFLGVRVLCGDIFHGRAKLYAVQDGRKLGIVWGYCHGDSMELHVGFDVHMDVPGCCRMIEREIILEHPYVKRLFSLIPAKNRAAQVLAVKLGFVAGDVSTHLGGDYIEYTKTIEERKDE